MSKRRCRAAVLISGSGSNLQSFIDHVERGELQMEIAVAIRGKPVNLGCETGYQFVFEAQTRFNCINSFRQLLIDKEEEQLAVKLALVALNEARRKISRYEKLGNRGSIARSEIDTARSAVAS